MSRRWAVILDPFGSTAAAHDLDVSQTIVPGHPTACARSPPSDTIGQIGACRRRATPYPELLRNHIRSEQMAVDQATYNQAKADAFVGKVLGDTVGMGVTILATLGDRLDLFKNLMTGPATSAELAARADINERYAREWLMGMTCAGYLDYQPATGSFALPPEHMSVLTQEAGPVFFGGVHQELAGACGLMGSLSPLVDAFRRGGGVPQSAYDDNMWEGMTRFTNGWFENLLVQQWIPAMPRVQTLLERGADVADVGCGHGRAILRLAHAYPNSRFTGYDAFEPSVARARSEAADGQRVRFELADVSNGLPGEYDIITTFDVVHDAVDPRRLLRSIRQALRPGGAYVCVDINCSDKLEENIGPLGALFSTFSILYCMTTSLAHGGEGLGTLGLPEAKLREFCRDAGFSQVERIDLENPFNNLYLATP
jgi:SAM-dependent methyltransferase